MSKVFLPCAIYTRKSSEEGLEQGFNSLDAQREACEAFIASQKHEGWKALATFYDDGGYSGGNMDRPGLKQLLSDIDKKKIKVVVVYKVDRLTRSLADFAKIVEQFDAKGVSFVSVTQQFNTTSSMGRLTLNVLLSFAQFEREVTGERIRDKIAASKQKGMWMGGTAPIGYQGKERTLVSVPDEAKLIQQIYERYLELGSIRLLKAELDQQGIYSPIRLRLSGNVYGGKPFSRGNLQRILTSRIYLGEMIHHDKSYPGQHPAIISNELWEKVNQLISSNRQSHIHRPQIPSINLLEKLLFDDYGERLASSHSTKDTKRYRYYLSQSLINGNRSSSSHGQRLPAQDLEDLVIKEVTRWLNNSNQVINELNPDPQNIPKLIHQLEDLIQNLQATELKQKTLQSLINKIVVKTNSIEIFINPKYFDIDLEPISICIPTELKRCGFAMRLIINNGEHQPNIDRNLIAHLSKAQEWFNRLKTGQAKSVEEIAEAENIDRSHVVRTLHRAFLAPDIVRSILKGEQPPNVTLKWLKQFRSLPIDWLEQKSLLGFK